MRDILIIKAATTYGSGMTGSSDITSLADGAVGVIDNLGNLVDATVNPVTILGDSINFALGRTLENVKVYPPIPRITSAEFAWEKKAYSAGQAQITTLGAAAATTDIKNFLPSTLVAGDEIGVIFVDMSKVHEDNTRQKRYDYVVTAAVANLATADERADAVAAALVALFNADTTVFVTAAVSGTSAGDNLLITFTTDAGSLNKPFKVVPTGESEWEAISVNATQAQILPTGTYAEVAATEQSLRAASGAVSDSTRVNHNLYTVAARAVVGVSYDLYTLRWYPNRTNKAYSSSNPDRKELQIALPTTLSATVGVQLENLLAAI